MPNTRPCNMCGSPMPIRRIPPKAPGAIAVDLAMCPRCDTIKPR